MAVVTALSAKLLSQIRGPRCLRFRRLPARDGGTAFVE
jgi:hypothetical protein